MKSCLSKRYVLETKKTLPCLICERSARKACEFRKQANVNGMKSHGRLLPSSIAATGTIHVQRTTHKQSRRSESDRQDPQKRGCCMQRCPLLPKARIAPVNRPSNPLRLWNRIAARVQTTEINQAVQILHRQEQPAIANQISNQRLMMGKCAPVRQLQIFMQSARERRSRKAR